MSEFIDPIKQVKKKVKLLEEASGVIKSSLRKQLEHQREFRGLELTKTEEYAKQAKPVIEAIGTLPNEEEKRLLKETDRNIVVNKLVEYSIPKYDPSYDIILKYFDNAYDVIKGRKSDVAKQRDIDMMVSSIDSLLATETYPTPSPIGLLSKNIFENFFLDKEYTLSALEKERIVSHEADIKDRELTEADKSVAEVERKIEAEAESLRQRTSKLELDKTIEENKISPELKINMLNLYSNNLREEGIDIDTSLARSELTNIFNFIHPFLITEKSSETKISKINQLMNSPIIKRKIARQIIRNKINNALLRTYTKSITTISSVKSVKEGLLDDIKKFSFVPRPSPPVDAPVPDAPAPAPALPVVDVPAIDILDTKPKSREIDIFGDTKPKSGEIEMIGDTSEERVNYFLNLPEVQKAYYFKSIAGKPYNGSLPILYKELDKIINKANLNAYEKLYAKEQAIKKYLELVGAKNMSGTKYDKLNADVKVIANSIPTTFRLNLKVPIKGMDGFGLKKKKKAEISGKGATGQGLMTDDPSKIDNYFDETGNSIAIYTGKVFRVMSVFIRRLNREMRSEWSPNDRLYFQIIALQKLIDLHNLNGPSETKDVMISSAKNLIEEKLSEFTNEDYKELAESKVSSISGSGLKKPHSMFEKKMKKKSNEDLLHNLQVHMGEVQAGNTGLKEPIKMILNEAVGRGIMKKQIATKISKNFC